MVNGRLERVAHAAHLRPVAGNRKHQMLPGADSSWLCLTLTDLNLILHSCFCLHNDRRVLELVLHGLK